MIDVDHQIGAVRRRLGTRMLDAGEARVLTIGQTYEVPVEDVWGALTDPERIPRWFLPVSGDLREGGRYQLEGNAGGTIGSCDPPTSFTATWEFGGQVSWIEVGLAAEPAGTRLELVHIAHVDDETWESFGPGAVGVGWDMALMGLGEHLATGGSADPAEIERWTASDEGRRFVELSSDRWRLASVEFGTDEESARAAADRTTAAYTATDEPEGRS
ncbi:SRPBCC family protein [Streptomonospora wellingtoniae]|uniref:SRPBCC family protein n=1 Tax=Streptomonospora wellingtoniae TaxID=3075544 RepID=A0ABU2KUU9_9ACTN|nr:SRPBCC family protein [Streptomonospora sp. DSM 45055]MDT0303076.1 SRPBCC family protein [Streptomonospora sp. DSM 45055]